jgi:hypothetical protein
MNPFNADLSKAAYATLETGTLKDVTDDYYYDATAHRAFTPPA